MSDLEREIDANQAGFFKTWTGQATKNWSALQSHKAFKDSYRRLTALQALKTHVITPCFSPDSAAFYFEAHNDCLISHVNASLGSWRSALQALRSCVENVLCAIYYNDHPVELKLWNSGRFKVSVSELFDYMEKHPNLLKLTNDVTGIAALRSEYADLSKAVHGSAKTFRMTDPVASVLLWNTDTSKASMWSTREKFVVEGVCLLLCCLHAHLLEGTKLTPVRDVLSFGISATKRTQLKDQLKVSITAP